MQCSSPRFVRSHPCNPDDVVGCEAQCAASILDALVVVRVEASGLIPPGAGEARERGNPDGGRVAVLTRLTDAGTG